MIFPKINAFPTYWENGMKLSASHFQHLENSIEDAVRDARALALAGNGGFGLLPNSIFTIQNRQGTTPQSVQVVLSACRAVMPGGYRIEILPENVQGKQLPEKAPSVEFVPNPSVRYHLFLVVDELKRVPAGMPQTRPIRYPHLVPDYKLEILPQDKVVAARKIASNRMKIAEWQQGKIVEGYIPPAMIIHGFPLLERWHQFMHNQLENMVRMSIQVIQEHKVKDPARAAFCAPIIQFIKSSQGYFKYVIPFRSPQYLVAYYADLAGLAESQIMLADRDFSRNRLKHGEINGLLPSIRELMNPRVIPLEEMAVMMNRMQKFGEALLLTIRSLITYTAPKPKSGDWNISSG